MEVKDIKNVQISKESVQMGVRALSVFWMKNKHWFFTLLFVCLTSYAAYEWYIYVYLEEDRVKDMRQQELQKAPEEFNAERFEVLLEVIQKRKTDNYIGAEVTRDIFNP